MAYRHGVYIQETPTQLTPPVQVDSALPVAFGTAPIHRLEDPVAAVNVPMIFYGYQEAVMAIGYSDDWTRFTLAEMLYSQFMVHNISPLVCVNIWNPLENAEDAAAVELQVLKGAVEIDDAMAMISTVSVLKAGDGAYVRGTDYSLAYDGDKLVITVLGGGKIPADVAALTVTYKKAVIDGIEAADIIGGIDPGTKKRSGIELADEVFLRFQKSPGFLLAPGWSDEPGVAAALMSKAKSLNSGNFSCIALLDFPTGGQVSNYSAVPEWKNNNGYNSPYAFGDWPCVAIDGR
ncbi:MAG: phage tail sheath family protein, partial [Clostridiales bacterium]|nr:phage tail sheath family protein [Clostridiales bacterium]